MACVLSPQTKTALKKAAKHRRIVKDMLSDILDLDPNDAQALSKLSKLQDEIRAAMVQVRLL